MGKLVLTPAALLERCNEFRRAGGAEEIKELIPSIPRHPQSCLIANNLNFDCRVMNVGGTEAWIVSDDVRLVDVAGTLGLLEARRSYQGGYAYILPEDLSLAAKQFDQRDYPSELYV